MLRGLDVASSIFTSVVRFGVGSRVGSPGARPELPLVLFEFEACPFCRKVREALSILDLEAEIRPCPKRGQRFRPEVERRGGKAQFPYLVDPNFDVALYESDAIVRHLFERYGDGNVPALLSLGLVTDLQASLAGLPRLGGGLWSRPSLAPDSPLELYSYEASPFCRIVREKLSELEIPYRLHNVAKGSRARDDFVKRSGKMQIPWLSDPNTGTELFESADIVRYLETQYVATTQ